MTRRQTYKNLKRWHQELRQYCTNIPCILVANKVDVDYLVSLGINTLNDLWLPHWTLGGFLKRTESRVA